MALRALIEVWSGEAGIYIHELPGVYAAGSTTDDALLLLPDVVEQHLAWLASHGFDVGTAPVEIAIAEVLPAVDGRRGPLFDADREPATSRSIEQALQVARLARRDLIDVYRAVSEVRRSQASAPGTWSMAEHLLHVAEMERFYLNCLPWGPDALLPADPVRALQSSAQLADSTLHAVRDEQRDAVYPSNGEQWTLAKVLRRMTGHLREHLPWLREIARG